MMEPTTYRRGRRRSLAVAAVGLLAGAALFALPGTASAAVVFDDTFEDGVLDGWQLTGGRWTVSSDGSRVLRQSSSGTGHARANAGDPTWQSYSVQALVKPTSLNGPRAAVGLIARANGNSGYHLTLRAGNRVELARVSGADRTVLASQALTVRPSTWYNLNLSLNGGQLTATVTGPGAQATLTVVDPAGGQGGIALYTERAAASFDNVLVNTVDPPRDTQPPSTPGLPQLLEVTPTTATITWPAATDNVGVTAYDIYHGDQFYEQYRLRRVTTNDPVTLPLDTSNGATLHFSIRALDAAGNSSQLGPRVTFPQPPTFPKSGNDTEAPTAPGAPVSVGAEPGGTIITWAPATDNIGVVEYHVIHTHYVDEVVVRAKVPGNVTTAVVPNGSFPNTVRIVAIDASWNRTGGPSAPLTPGTPPTPTPGG